MNKLFGKKNSENVDTYIVISDFENLTEYQCKQMDKKNEKIYKILCDRAKKANDMLGPSLLAITVEVPLPPRPTNYDRFMIWKKRNCEKKVVPQSEAVLFLHEQGYILHRDYEAYQAIELAHDIKKQLNLEDTNKKDLNKNFDQVFTKNDTNILRRRSFMRLMPKTKSNTSIKITPSAPPLYPSLEEPDNNQ